jgi:hypothetical protein
MYLYRDGGKTLHLTDHPAGLAVWYDVIFV